MDGMWMPVPGARHAICWVVRSAGQRCASFLQKITGDASHIEVADQIFDSKAVENHLRIIKICVICTMRIVFIGVSLLEIR